MYQVEGDEVLRDWLASEADPGNREQMLAFIARLAEEPRSVGHRIPGERAPIYLAMTPVGRTVVRFLLAEQFHVVRLIAFDDLL